jgi:hypothetical protein
VYKRIGYNIKMFLKELSCEDIEWIYPVQDGDQKQALENIAMNCLVPNMRGNY